jgi:hypothetical protein
MTMPSWRIKSGTNQYIAPAPDGTPATNNGVEAIFVGYLAWNDDQTELAMVWDDNLANGDGTFGNVRLPMDAEALQDAIALRIVSLKRECEQHIDASIQPVTRDMLRDGVLDNATADAVREHIAACYEEANRVIDLTEAVTDINDVDNPAPVWPAYGGA